MMNFRQKMILSNKLCIITSSLDHNFHKEKEIGIIFSFLMLYSSVLPLRCPLITNRPFDGVYAWASSLKTQSILLIRVIIVFDVYLISIFSRKRVHRVAKETDWEMCALCLAVDFLYFRFPRRIYKVGLNSLWIQNTHSAVSTWLA